jgi:hypothetical protein
VLDDAALDPGLAFSASRPTPRGLRQREAGVPASTKNSDEAYHSPPMRLG